MDPLIWLKMVAYAERIPFELRHDRERREATRRVTRRAQMMRALRAALADLVENAGELAAVSIRTDGSDDGFFVVASDGPHESTMQVMPDGDGLQCRYWSATGDRQGRGDLRAAIHLVFGGRRLVPVLAHSEGTTCTFHAAEQLSAHLLAPLARGEVCSAAEPVSVRA